MTSLPTSPNNTPFLEKALRFVLFGALIYGGIKAYNAWFAPNINLFMHNIPYMIGFGVFCLFVVFGFMNYKFLWMQFKNICHYVTSAFIKMDPLSFMDRYIDILTDKRAGLALSREKLNAQAIALKRQVDQLQSEFNSMMERSEASTIDEDKGHYASLAETYKESASHLIPLLQKITASNEFLGKLYENWGRSLDKLKETVKVKREEFNAVKEAAKAMGLASDFANGDSQEYKIFMESTQALEQNVTSKMSYIQNFMEDSKDIMKTIDLDKSVDKQKGLSLLEKYKTNKNLFLPETDWASEGISLSSTKSVHAMVNSKKGDSSSAASLIDIN